MGLPARGSSSPGRVAPARRRRPAGLRPLPCRLHRLALRRDLPARPRRRGPALPPAALDDAPRGPLPLPGPPRSARVRSLPEPRHGGLGPLQDPSLLEDHLAIDSVDGLLLLLGDQYQRGIVRLLHPFTGDIVDLPPLATLLPQLGDSMSCCPVLYRIKNLASRVCASASFKDGVITVMLALDVVSHVAFATSLDQQWNLSEFSADPSLAFQGKLYMLKKAECCSEILVLGYRGASRSRILICRLADLVLQRIIPIRSIGDNTLFLDERCISVASKVLSTVRGDNVVCFHPRQDYLAQYHLSSGTWSRAIDDCSLYGRAQGPSSLVLYIYSCCTRTLWYGGLFT
ncbi:hypothetical protein HU200_015745 [Digitaria exilis]|uniref:KIB1-4 beta-propeller domain-containing protein n=1 Tax=Digitaria exilis TaxID=1010633 RepID=A0A835F8X4_9POAL|nr:hypothetical protein HU200_015745 [Digitaria exilis]